MNTLIVSDNIEFGRIWTYALQQRGLEVFPVKLQSEWSLDLRKRAIDLIVVDIYDTKLDSLQVCKSLRAESTKPILLLAPIRDEAYSLEAYNAGVDECISKPISPSLLLAKVTAWMRFAKNEAPTKNGQGLEWSDIRLDPLRRVVVLGEDKTIRLTTLEFRLLRLLMSNPNQVLETDLIIDRVWGYKGDGHAALVKNLIYRLRRKIEQNPRAPSYIQTYNGEGYAFQSG